MSESRLSPGRPAGKLLFLGTGAAIQLPAFFCTCAVCEQARANPAHRRTRASLALIGQETVLVDAGPDLEFQLERESIRQVDRVWITHWHFDHIAGLAALAEPAVLEGWAPIDIYLPAEAMGHFEQELAYMRSRVLLHPIQPGDRIELEDAVWEVVKTTHTEDSLGFIVEAGQRFAYLVDGVVPPPQTVERLKGLDLVVLEATVDELVLPEGRSWANFSLPQALAFWRELEVERCILTHLSCHSWKQGRLSAGLSHEERRALEAATPGLTVAYDGMQLEL